jgi:hypothetical protein
MARCQRIKGDGQRCKLPAIGSNGLCYSHDPSKQQERHRSAQRGGKAGGRGRASVELKELKGRFEDLAERVLKKKIDRGSAAVAGQLLAQARMCVRDGLLAREQEELIQEVQEVKRDLEAERQRNRRFGA